SVLDAGEGVLDAFVPVDAGQVVERALLVEADDGGGDPVLGLVLAVEDPCGLLQDGGEHLDFEALAAAAVQLRQGHAASSRRCRRATGVVSARMISWRWWLARARPVSGPRSAC